MNDHAVAVTESLKGCWYCAYTKKEREEIAHRLQEQLFDKVGLRTPLGHAMFHFIHWIDEIKEKKVVVETIPRYQVTWVIKTTNFKGEQ